MGRLPTGFVAGPDVSGSAISGVVLRRAVPEDRAQLIQGSRELLGREVSEEAWDWWFQRSPAGPAIQVVLDQSGRLVGHLARVRGDVWVARERLKIGLGSYTWVAPGHQGQGGFRRLLSACLAEDPGVDLQVGFSDQRLGRLYEHVGAGRNIGLLRWWSGGEDVFDGRVGPHYALLRLAARMATWIFSAGPPLARVRPLALEECADEPMSSPQMQPRSRPASEFATARISAGAGSPGRPTDLSDGWPACAIGAAFFAAGSYSVPTPIRNAA
jgi:hypothetical protein